MQLLLARASCGVAFWVVLVRSFLDTSPGLDLAFGSTEIVAFILLATALSICCVQVLVKQECKILALEILNPKSQKTLNPFCIQASAQSCRDKNSL